MQILDGNSSNSWYSVGEEMQADDYHLDEMNLGPNDVVIDIGTNIGITAIYIAKKFGCRVIGFEPMPPTYNLLVNNIKINDVAHLVTVHNCAITKRGGDTLPITYDENRSSASTTWLSGEYWNCRTETIDKYIEDLDSIKLFKIDCEGGEYEVVPAIIPYMSKIENIVVEYHKYVFEQQPEELHKTIKENFKGNLIATIAPNTPVTW